MFAHLVLFGPSRVQHDVMHKLLIQGGKIGPIKFYTCETLIYMQLLAAVQFVISDSAAQYVPSTYSSSFEFFYAYVPWSSLGGLSKRFLEKLASLRRWGGGGGGGGYDAKKNLQVLVFNITEHVEL